MLTYYYVTGNVNESASANVKGSGLCTRTLLLLLDNNALRRLPSAAFDLFARARSSSTSAWADTWKNNLVNCYYPCDIDASEYT